VQGGDGAAAAASGGVLMARGSDRIKFTFFLATVTCVIVGHTDAGREFQNFLPPSGGVRSVNVKCKVHTRLMLSVGF
jgi:hypothetical protein